MAGKSRNSVVSGITLMPHATSAGTARQFVDETLRARGADRLLEDAVLLSNELVANAVLRTQRPLALTLLLEDGRLRVAVADAGPKPSRQEEKDRWGEEAQWLELVNALATSWGIDRHFGGKVIWFELLPREASGGTNGRS
jgi:hypothetical protein